MSVSAETLSSLHFRVIFFSCCEASCSKREKSEAAEDELAKRTHGEA